MFVLVGKNEIAEAVSMMQLCCEMKSLRKIAIEKIFLLVCLLDDEN